MKQKKILKLISALSLIILVLSNFSSCKVKSKEYDYVYFGEYPQTLKADDVIITSDIDSRGYYLGSDGCYYAKVVATPYEWYNTKECTFSTGTAVKKGSVYYFKVEPIRWRILCKTDGKALVMCDSIIANKAFDTRTKQPGEGDKILNNYGESEIRFWLNNQFYNIAFTDTQKESIITTVVDNSLESSGVSNSTYSFNDTEDKLFLLSYSDLYNKDYGFDGHLCVERQLEPSDYAKATGTEVFNKDQELNGYGCGYWLLRSPWDGGSGQNVYIVHAQSYLSLGLVQDSQFGVVPAMWITLES